MDYIPEPAQEAVYRLNPDIDREMNIPRLLPLKEYDGIEDWDQYLTVAKAYTDINNWDKVTFKS